MKRLACLMTLLVLLGATFGGCTNTSNDNSRGTNSNTPNANGAQTTPTPSAQSNLGQLLANASASTDDRVKATDAYVAEVESKLSGLTRKEKVLKPEDLKGITESKLEKIHAYYDGQNIKRVKTYPARGARKTEEFYFYNNQLVFVFVEPQGAGKEGSDRSERGERLYFGNAGLVAWYGEDGKAKDPASDEFKTKSQKMVLEAVAFRKLAG